MKRLTLIATIIGTLTLAAGAAYAQGYHYVSPYSRPDGTYVQPHYQTNPNGNRYRQLEQPTEHQPLHRAARDTQPLQQPLKSVSLSPTRPTPVPKVGGERNYLTLRHRGLTAPC